MNPSRGPRGAETLVAVMENSRWILVAGGSRGIGRGLVEGLGASYPVVSWSRRDGIDLLDEAKVVAEARRLEAERSTPWGLVHTVGDFLEKPVLETSPEEWEHMLSSNLRSALVLLRAWVPSMRRAGRGRVVLFGAAGVCQDTGKKRAPAYFAVKAALMTVARSLAEEVASSGVTVNVVSPGLILHESSYVASQRRMLPRVPAGRMGSPADVVGAVRFLLSDEASYVTGIDLEVDGGLHL